MNGTLLPVLLWSGAAVAGAGYGVLFLLARQAVALRLVRLGIALFAVLLLRLVLLPWHPLDTVWEVVLVCGVLASASGLCLGRRVWLVRGTADEFRAQVREGCRGLFLGCAESAGGCFQLTAKEGTWPLRLRPVSGRVQLVFVVVPRCPDRGKVALFVHWLSKQYPGPVPRVRIILHRSEP